MATDTPGPTTPTDAAERPPNFIRDIIAADVAAGRNGGRVQTRFPPEPNGYLHIGHAKAILVSFGMAEEFGGLCNLRLDDTNPEAEEARYVEQIIDDIRWLGCDWGDRLFFASDYYEQLYAFAEQLVRAGKAYVCSLSAEELKELRGSFYEPGVDSPFRGRSIEESLDLFRRMRAGEFADGEHTLRAKIDMRSPNMNLRDPPLYRIKRARHHRTGDAWCIYPMYDFAHALSDAIEGITHSLCSLEFADHRPLYDWCIESVEVPSRPRQYEFGRLNLSYTVLSKRRLLQLVDQGLVDGWDDPRMPTLAGMRRRGFAPEAIRRFADSIAVTKHDGVVDVSLLEFLLREDLNAHSPRVMAVLRPLKIVIEGFPRDHVEWLDAPYFPDAPERGSRKVPLTRELYIERDDFREEAPRKWFRFAPGAEVRLRYGCLVRCTGVVKDASGAVTELRCTWDPDSLGGVSPDGRKVRGTSHWVSAAHAVPAEVRLYDRLFSRENPLAVADGEDWKAALNPSSLETLTGCMLEPSLAGVEPGSRWQFERLGYFCVDTKDSRPGAPVFDRTVTLRDSWAKIEAKMKKG